MEREGGREREREMHNLQAPHRSPSRVTDRTSLSISFKSEKYKNGIKFALYEMSIQCAGCARRRDGTW